MCVFLSFIFSLSLSVCLAVCPSVFDLAPLVINLDGILWCVCPVFHVHTQSLVHTSIVVWCVKHDLTTQFIFKQGGQTIFFQFDTVSTTLLLYQVEFEMQCLAPAQFDHIAGSCCRPFFTYWSLKSGTQTEEHSDHAQLQKLQARTLVCECVSLWVFMSLWEVHYTFVCLFCPPPLTSSNM